MTYQLGIDLGTTYTAAAIYRDGRAEIVTLGDRAAAIPSAVFLKEDETVLTGDAASRRAMSEPGRIAREFKRRIGDPTPILLGGSPYSAESLMAKLLRWVVDKVTELEGGPPSHITVSHPANWGPYKKDLLEQAVHLADLERATTVTEPEAAAICYASNERIDVGAVVAVYDLGGGTFDAAVLRKTADGWDILGQPEGVERLGGIDFDQAVFSHVRTALAGKIEELDLDDTVAVGAVGRLREDCIAAKEALSSDTDATVPVLLPNVSTEVRINRAELESLIRPTLQDTVAALRRALRSANIEPVDVSAVLLVGGSSRIPLVSQLVGAELGRPVAVDAHPKHSIALGAAMAAARAVHGAAVADVVVEPIPVEPTAAEVTTITPASAPAPAPAPAEPVAAATVPPAPPVFTPTTTAPAARNRNAMVLGAVALVIVAAAAAFFLLGSSGDDDDTATATTTTVATSSTAVAPAGTGDSADMDPPVARIGQIQATGNPGRYVFPVEPLGFTIMALDGQSTRDGDYEIHLFWNTIEPQAAFGNDPNVFLDWRPRQNPNPTGLVDNQFFNVSAKPPGATAICSVLGLGLSNAPDLNGDGAPDYKVDCAPLPDAGTAAPTTGGGSQGTGAGQSLGTAIQITQLKLDPDSPLVRFKVDPAQVGGQGRHLHFYWSDPNTKPIFATASAPGTPVEYGEWGTPGGSGLAGQEDEQGNGDILDNYFSRDRKPAEATSICAVVVNADHTMTDVDGDVIADHYSCMPLPPS